MPLRGIKSTKIKLESIVKENLRITIKMGCSPSTLARSNGSEATEATAAAVAVAAANEKDGSIFFCLKFRRDRLRRCSQLNGCEGSGGSGTGSGSARINNEDFCNQALLNPLQMKNEADYEKVSALVRGT